MTQMTFPMAFPTTRRAEAVTTMRPRWRLLGAEVTAALVVNLGTEPVTRQIDRGVMTTSAAPGTVIVGPGTRLVAVQPSITSW